MLVIGSHRQLLFGSFVAMILLTIVLGIGALRVSDNLIDLNRKMVAHPFTVSNAVRDIKGTIVGIHRDMKDIALILGPDQMDGALAVIDRSEAHVFERFDIVGKRFLGDKAQVEEARRTFAAWRDIRAQVVELARNGQRQQAAAITTGKGAEHVRLMTRQLDGLLDFAHNKAAQFLSDSNEEHARNRMILIALIVVVVASGSAIAIFAITTVSKTERKLVQREQQVREAKKMEAIGQLSGGLAHDLNNVLGIISGNVELLELKLGDDAELGKYIVAAKKGVTRASELTRKLLDFSRTTAGETTRVTANAFILDMKNLISRSLTPAIALEMALSDDPWKVEIDPGDLEAALINLSLNSRDAMPQGGSLVIETANKVIDQDYVRTNPASSAGEFVMISVSDTGCGMTPEQAEKAFEPFFTTKEVGKGTGLGLSTVYAFVQRSGGHVKIYSELDKGTTVRLYLPRSRGEADRMESKATIQEPLPRGDETILIVDDEPQLVEAAASILGSLGYNTVTATGSKEAQEILRQDKSIDLLFCDVIMPGNLDGYHLAIEALADNPKLKALLTSGFTRRREEFVNGERRIASELAKNLLQKPYNMPELAVAVRQALDRDDPWS